MIVGRIGATLIFAILAASVGREFVDSVAQAAADSELRSWLVAVYHLLKLGVALAFTVFVLTRGPSRRPSREPVAFAACAVAILSVVMMEPPAESAGTALVLAGESLAVIGCAGMLLAVLALGRCFGVLPEARGLVTHGPYEFVRHPLYLGEFGGVAGLAIA